MNPMAWSLVRCIGCGLVLIGASSRAADPDAGSGADVRGPGTIRMAERLEEIARRANPMQNRFLAAGQVPMLREAMAKSLELARDPSMHFRLGTALLNSGSNLEALASFDAVERIAT